MKPYKYIFVILALALLAACSTTTSVPEDDQLFIGLKTTKYVDYEPSDHFNATREEVEAAQRRLLRQQLHTSAAIPPVDI